MRLKFFFFPVIIVISISIFVGFIWPLFKDLKSANEEKIEIQNSLSAIEEKRSAIEKVNSQITGDSQGEALVNSYLPSSKAEERILTNINYLATSSEVSLVNVSLEDVLTGNDSAVVVDSSVAAAGNGENGATIINTNASGLKKTEAKISVSGEYDKIRFFLDQLQRTPLMNSVKSVNIEKQETTKSSNSAAAQGTEGQDAQNQTEQNNSKNLLADLVIEFGWMPLVNSVDNTKITNFENKFDDNTVAVLREYTSQNNPSPESFGNKDGKNNPFQSN